MLGGAALVGLGACSRSSPAGTPAGSLAALQHGAASVAMLGPSTPVNPGVQTFSFYLAATQTGPITQASPRVWVARSDTAGAMGPTPGVWYPMNGYDETHDTSPRSPLAVGVYSARIDLPSPGVWIVAAEIKSGGRRLVGTQAVSVTNQPIPGGIGTHAVDAPTPVATTRRSAEEICTRRPPDPMHYVSLDDALRNGLPTVVVFATPLLCASQTCGPVVDEQILVFEKYGPSRANFIHVEEFLPGRDLKPPPPTVENLSPAFKAWKFDTEPWVIIIDRRGVVRARLGPGATAAEQIEAALQPLIAGGTG
jgi:hypothetical protein